MPYDFSKEEEQLETNAGTKKFGPVPAGSIVWVRLSVLEAPNPDPEDASITISRSGMRQVQLGFEVIKGEYEGVTWRQFVALPSSMQKIQLTDGQATACRIGGAQLKAFCLCHGKGMVVKGMKSFDGIEIPVKVRIRKTPSIWTDKTGKERVSWYNEMTFVLTPDKEDYRVMQIDGEIIDHNGATSCEMPSDYGQNTREPQPQANVATNGTELPWPAPQENLDAVPF